MAAEKSVSAAQEAKRAYLREWRKKNPDKAKAIQTRYWAKKAAQMMEERESAASCGELPQTAANCG